MRTRINRIIFDINDLLQDTGIDEQFSVSIRRNTCTVKRFSIFVDEPLFDGTLEEAYHYLEGVYDTITLLSEYL